MNESLFGTKKLGFGMMRLPMCKNDGAPDTVDTDQVCRMVDRFLERGFCYFDTAHGYLDGQSETALRTCLTSRHPRHTYRLTNKLSGGFFKTEADIRPLFESQLAACGVEYSTSTCCTPSPPTTTTIFAAATPSPSCSSSRRRERSGTSASPSMTSPTS